MAIADALAAIDRHWSDTEPLLSVATLAGVASLQWQGVSDPDDLAELVVTRVLSELPRDHEAWRAVTRTGTRFQAEFREPVQVLAARCVLHALQTVADPEIAQRAIADFLEGMARATIWRHGVVQVTATSEEAASRFDALRIGDDGALPAFAFASIDPLVAHEIVLQLHELLDGFGDPIGAASWWLTPNHWLETEAPADLLGQDRDAEIAFAAEQLSNDSW